jgi:hypothetical protein
MKFVYKHIALLLLLLSACTDPLEDKVFAPQNAHVRFEFNTSSGPTNPTTIPPDTILINQNADNTLRIPVILSSSPLEEEVRISYSVQTSGNIQPEDYILIDNGQSAEDFLLTIPPAAFETAIVLLINNPPGEDGYIRLRLEGVTPDFLSLGLPGPQQQRRSFTILFDDL